jgi:hypothetical protein
MRPFTFGGPADSPRGLMVGGRVERQAGDATLSVTASRLDEPTFGRRLDAVGTGLTLRNGLVGDLTSEVGYRRSRTAQGLGWATELRRQGDAGALSLRLAHAPGGSLAYARAADELNAAASRRLTRALSVNGAYWRTADQGLGVGRMRSEGWSVGPGATLFGGLATLSLEARGNGFEAKSAAGGFGNAERQGVAGLDVRRGRFHMSGGATLANARRTTIVTGDTLPTLTGTRSEQRLFAGADLAGGSIEAGDDRAALHRRRGRVPAAAVVHAARRPLRGAGAAPAPPARRRRGAAGAHALARRRHAGDDHRAHVGHRAAPRGPRADRGRRAATRSWQGLGGGVAVDDHRPHRPAVAAAAPAVGDGGSGATATSTATDAAGVGSRAWPASWCDAATGRSSRGATAPTPVRRAPPPRWMRGRSRSAGSRRHARASPARRTTSGSSRWPSPACSSCSTTSTPRG